MKVLKKWNAPESILKENDEPIGWFEDSLKDCVDFVEGRKYYKKGTVVMLLADNNIIKTPFCDYKRT